MKRSIYLGDKEIVMESVAQHDNTVLYRYESNGFINSATDEEIKKEFPDYKFELCENFIYDFMIEKDGVLQVKEPDEE